MVGTNGAEHVDVAVVGGGLAGLAAAATAATAAAGSDGRRVLLLEGHPLGGRARTDERSGYLFNRGPRALYLGAEGRRVLERFGVELAGGPPAIRGAMGLREGRLHLLPGSPASLLRTTLLGPGAKVRLAAMLTRLPKIQTSTLGGSTLNEWLVGTGLPRQAADLVRMLARVATYLDAPDLISADIAVHQLQLALGDGVRYLDGGFQTLVDGLAAAARAAGAELRTGVNVRGIDDGNTGAGVTVHTDAGPVSAGSVILAAGTPAACAAVLGHRPAAWERLGPEVGAACLELGLRRPPATRVLFGVDQPVYCNTHCPPARLAADGAAVVHVLRYQSPGGSTTADQDEAELRAVARHAGITDADIVEQRFLRRMVVSGGFPTPAGGGLAGRPPSEVEGHPRVYVAGDWVGPTGMLADAALASALTAAEKATHQAMIPV